VREKLQFSRQKLADAYVGKLLFSTVREDPEIEVSLLRPALKGRIVVVGSGGCTALSLLARGAEHVEAVDMNSTQCHLVELKAAALTSLEREQCVGFLGGRSLPARQRVELWRQVRASLSAEALAFWQAHPNWVKRGVLRSGATERFISALRWLVRSCVQSRRTVSGLLAAHDLDEQRAVYDSGWNNRRWRLLFRAMLNRLVMGKSIDERLFLRANVPSIAGYFLDKFEHALCRIPVASNYFLHHMLTGFYGAALPPYLAESPSPDAWQGRLTIVDGSMTHHLASRAPGSVRGFALSNICEWLTEAELKRLLFAVGRAAEDGARVVIRNFLGWTDVPLDYRALFREEALDNAELMDGERSLMQRRVLLCRIDKSALPALAAGQRADGGAS
jgi:S-adenosylmethionine-diacylglycerol 3-amino-3-carboxypropyl transferase